MPCPASIQAESARFLAEAETIARLRHPNIVQIYGLGEHDGLAYFEMEYIEGGSLARRLDGTPWAPEPAARMVAVLARAIGDAHRLGIVHRDLKPANVLLADDDTPKVVDFGLAKSLEADSSLTQSGVFVGTPSYAAPEQVDGQGGRPGRRHLRAGGDLLSHADRSAALPGGDGPPDAGTGQDGRPGAALAAAAGPVPGCGDDRLKCLEKDPQRRYADAAALAEDLDRFLAGRPILARPTGPAERLRKWVRRRPAVALLSAAVVAVTVLGFILVAWQWRRAEAKAAAEAAANEMAQQARLVAFEGRGPAHVPPGTGPVRPGRGGARPLVAGPQPGAGRGSQVRGPRPTHPHQPGRLGEPTEPTPAVTADAALRADPGACLPPRGPALVSVGEDGVARIWDTATGKEIGPPLELEDEPAGARLERARFGPAESGLLGAVDDRGRATVWDVDHRRRLASPPSCPPGQQNPGHRLPE